MVGGLLGVHGAVATGLLDQEFEHVLRQLRQMEEQNVLNQLQRPEAVLRILAPVSDSRT